MFKQLPSWLGRALSEENGLPSTRRLLFALTVIACLSFTGGHIISKGLDALAVDMLKTTLFVTAGAYGVTKATEVVKG